MTLIDFEREWSGDSFAVSLTQKQRAILLQLAFMMVEQPKQFVLDYDNINQELYTDETDSLLHTLMTEYIIQPEIGYQNKINLWARDGHSNTANNPAITINSTHIYNYYMTIPSPAQYMQFLWQYIYLTEGNWRITVDYAKVLNSGIAQIDFSDMAGAGTHNITNVAQIDMHGSFAPNQRVDTTFTVSVSDSYRCVFTMGSKNPASNNYQINITHVLLEKLE